MDAAVLRSAAADAANATWIFHDLPDPFSIAEDREVVLLTDVWAFSPDFVRALLVQHARRGWVMPGGKVEHGETVRAAAARELFEETGIAVDEADLSCIAVTGRASDVVSIGLSYVAVVDDSAPLLSEPGQPAAWWSLDDEWNSIYPHDRQRLRDFVSTIR